MSELTQILIDLEGGDLSVIDRLFPLVYDELRHLAASKIAGERPGHTLQSTALVHEVFLKLATGSGREFTWQSREQFFAAAANAMRRILVDAARKKQASKRGADMQRVELCDFDLATEASPERLVAINEAIEQLQVADELAGKIFDLRVFTGLTLQDIADALSLSRSEVHRQWTFARAFVLSEIR